MSEAIELLYERVQKELSSIRSPGGPVILDAATGAGNSALRVARMLTCGRLITVDKDPEAWTGFAREKVEAAGLIDRVQFLQADMAKLDAFNDETFDLIFSGATLSAMGLAVVDGIQELFRVAKPGALLALYDLLPQPSAQDRPQRNAVDAWRIGKAIDVLSGQPHYEEFPLAWVCRRLSDAGFAIEWQDQDKTWEPASEESISEYLSDEDWDRIESAEIRHFFKNQCFTVKDRIRREGMTNFSLRYTLCARKPIAAGIRQ